MTGWLFSKWREMVASKQDWNSVPDREHGQLITTYTHLMQSKFRLFSQVPNKYHLYLVPNTKSEFVYRCPKSIQLWRILQIPQIKASLHLYINTTNLSKSALVYKYHKSQQVCTYLQIWQNTLHSTKFVLVFLIQVQQTSPYMFANTTNQNKSIVYKYPKSILWTI